MKATEISAALPRAAASARGRADRARAVLGMFLIGGGLYCLLETAWRGWTHWTMFLAGGLLFLLLGLERGPRHRPLPLLERGVLGGLTITGVELAFGCVVNLWLHMRVWDYADKPYNLLGQIALSPSVLWCLLSIVGAVAYDLLYWLLFDGEKPRFRLL